MPLPEFRVSEVETFRRWLVDEEADTSWLIHELASDEPNEAMLKGTAFHKALELAQPGKMDSVASGNYIFHFDCDIQIELPMVREIRRAKNYGGISISGQVDCAQGNLIVDHKTTGYFDADRYMAGYQWRYYLDIFKADRFRWNIFEMKEIDALLPEVREYSVRALHVLEQFRYPALENDCRELALNLRDFAAMYLPERVSA